MPVHIVGRVSTFLSRMRNRRIIRNRFFERFILDDSFPMGDIETLTTVTEASEAFNVADTSDVSQSAKNTRAEPVTVSTALVTGQETILPVFSVPSYSPPISGDSRNGNNSRNSPVPEYRYTGEEFSNLKAETYFVAKTFLEERIRRHGQEMQASNDESRGPWEENEQMGRSEKNRSRERATWARIAKPSVKHGHVSDMVAKLERKQIDESSLHCATTAPEILDGKTFTFMSLKQRFAVTSSMPAMLTQNGADILTRISHATALVRSSAVDFVVKNDRIFCFGVGTMVGIVVPRVVFAISNKYFNM